MSAYHTPLRYPGGKAKLAPFITSVFKTNGIIGGQYIEPYAGGAAIAFDLLFSGAASHVHLNDIDYAVFCFWQAVLAHTDWLCRKIRLTPVTVDQWLKQKETHREGRLADPLDLGFAFFFLNRTNRSGILNGGIIGGLDQSGEWKIDARYYKRELIRRIEAIGAFRDRISIYNQDAADFIEFEMPQIPLNSLAYFDPPYFLKGQRLYQNHYKKKDHAAIAARIQAQVDQHWIVSYDKVPDIIELYRGRMRAIYSLDYSARTRSVGTEVMFFSNNLVLPEERSAGMRVYAGR